MRIIYLIFCLFIAVLAYSQKPISGTVQSTEGEIIAFASVALLQATDSSMVAGDVTNMEGKFSIEVIPGTYLLQISFLSYETYSMIVEHHSGPSSLGIMQLENNSVLLEGVEVEAERSQMIMKLDKRIFNVGKDLTSRGGSASDILDNVPSVNVDVEGNISLRGSQNVRILIDGKPSALIRSGGQALRQIPANMIESVEVITNPSARYEAEGEVGIINIVMKKNQKKKLNGSLELSTGLPANHGFNYNISLRNKKMGFNSSYGIQYRKFEGGGLVEQNFFDTSIADYKSTRDHQRGGLNHNIRLGLDWYPGKKNTISISGFYNIGRNENGADINYEFLEESGALIEKITRDDNEIEKRNLIEGEIRHEKIFTNKDHKWSSFVSINRRDDKEDNEITENGTEIEDILQKVDNREDAQTILAQSDFTYPFASDGLFETGLRGSFRRIENEFTVWEGTNENNLKILDNFNNLFDYQEDIYAAYVMAGNKQGKISYQGGMRVEHSEIVTDLVKTNERNPRSYTNLFPSALIGYEMDSIRSMQLSFSRRLTRPRLWSLFPFFTFSDNRNLASGNPNLDPEYTNAFELSYLRRLQTGSWMAALVYRHSTGVIERINLLEDDGITRWFPVNIATKDAFGVEFNYSIKPLKWFKINGDVYMAYEEIRGSYENVDLSVELFNATSRITTEYELGKNTDLQITFRYNSPRNSPQGEREHMAHVNLAFSQKLFNNKGSLTLSVSDLFNSRVRRNETITQDYTQYSEFQWRTRQTNLTFSYRLGDNGGRRSRGGPPRG
jgi:hypothetical protein